MAGRLWSLVSLYLVVPLYLRALGVEAYGAVGFYTVLQGVLTFADAGLTAALSREAARLKAAPGGGAELRNVVRTVELVYVGVWSLVALCLWLVSPFIATRWLNPGAVPPPDLLFAVRAMAVAIPLQFFAGFYLGGLMGLERQVSANVLQVAWSTLRSGGAAIGLFVLSPTLTTYFAIQLVANALYLFGSRVMLLRVLPGPPASGVWSRAVVQRLTRYIGGMTALSMLSAVLVQADKLAVSKLLPLAALGAYSIASTLAQLPMSFAWPVATAVFPTLTVLAEQGDRITLAETYHRACQLVAVATAPMAIGIALFGRELVLVWTGRPDTAASVAGPLLPLALGSLFLALLLVPFQLALASAWIRLNLLLSSVSVVLIVPLLILLIRSYGPVGAGFAWMTLNAAMIPPFVFFLHRRLLPGATTRWVLEDLLRPVVAAAVITVAVRLLLPSLLGAGAVLIPLAVGMLALVASAVATPASRQLLRSLQQRTRVPASP